MRIIIIGILYIFFMLFGCPVWLAGTDVPYIVRALTYSFFHANILHLAINCLSVWLIWSGKNTKCDIRNFFTAFVIAVLVYPLGFRPCVGISNLLFAAGGLRVRPQWLKTPKGVLFLVLMFAMCFLPQFAGTNHVAAFALGMTASGIARCIEPIMKDVRRFS